MCVKGHAGKGWDRPREEAPGGSVEGIKSPVEMARGTCLTLLSCWGCHPMAWAPGGDSLGSDSPRERHRFFWHLDMGLPMSLLHRWGNMINNWGVAGQQGDY